MSELAQSRPLLQPPILPSWRIALLERAVANLDLDTGPLPSPGVDSRIKLLEHAVAKLDLVTTTALPPSYHGADSGTTRPALTPSWFPHIWDHILELVDDSVLLALRLTSRDVLRRINKHLYAHVVVHQDRYEGDMRIWLSGPGTRRRVPGLNWNGSQAARSLCLVRLEEHCTTLDEVFHAFQHMCNCEGCRMPPTDERALVQLEDALHWVTTHRRHGSLYKSMFSLPNARRLMAFAGSSRRSFNRITSRLQIFMSALEATNHLQSVPCTGARSVVISLHAGEQVDAEYLQRMENLTSVMIILRAETGPNSGHIPEHLLGILGTLLATTAQLLPRVPFTFVGLEAVREEFVSADCQVMRQELTGQDALRRRIAAFVHWVHATDSHDPNEWQLVEDFAEWKERTIDHGREDSTEFTTLLNAITLRTLESQREIMGERLFKQVTVPPVQSSDHRYGD